MRIFRTIERVLKALLPSPFSIALLLTAIVVIFGLILPDKNNSFWDIAGYWEKGLWEPGLLAFAVQMMLMLVLGHVLALSEPIDRVIRKATGYCDSTAFSAFLVTLLTLLVALFNWGLGLIFGAIMARKVAEHAERENLILNYPLIAAAGYSGLMVWHGGISGSAPIKAAESGHIKALMNGVIDEHQLAKLPDAIPLSQTVFGEMNLFATLLLLVLLPLFMYALGKRFPGTVVQLKKHKKQQEKSERAEGADRLDHSRIFASVVGIAILVVLIGGVDPKSIKSLSFITPNFINMLLLGLGLLAHKTINGFTQSVDHAIGGAAGILIQFPLYFGIMGIMNHSGLISIVSDAITSISTAFSFPLYAFSSAGIVNLFVPSGGGQWGVQGPILLSSALELGVSLPKAVMALAYGDQLTNMLQPFWALPLLGITGLSARSILPYTVVLMLLGIVIFSGVLMIF